ncbi:FAD-dependent monooxygenase [Nonomuraea typhae]|uniref:FAD-dependent monooxygenase n=1 Tax=Nonomuraea typhae TaxID=2603600 RepID=UPI0012F7276E|nr:FAD-dependent monooxygenase [Nonomuraea typhae]
MIEHGISIVFRADLEPALRGRLVYAVFGEFGTFVRRREDLWQLVVPYDPATRPPDTCTEQRCLDLIRAASGLPDINAAIVTVLPLEMRAEVADRFHRGRVFLFGDAAHPSPPAGGLGGNLCIQDAHVVLEQEGRRLSTLDLVGRGFTVLGTPTALTTTSSRPSPTYSAGQRPSDAQPPGSGPSESAAAPARSCSLSHACWTGAVHCPHRYPMIWRILRASMGNVWKRRVASGAGRRPGLNPADDADRRVLARGVVRRALEMEVESRDGWCGGPAERQVLGQISSPTMCTV